MPSVNAVVSESVQDQELKSFIYPSCPAPNNIILLFRDYKFDHGESNIIRRTTTIPTGAISLPIPDNLQDSYEVQVGGQEIGLLGSLIGEIKNKLDEGNLDDFLKEENIENNVQGFFDYAKRHGLDVLGVTSDILSPSQGTVKNPHLALKFDGVDLKNHSFEWTLSPKNEKESETIRYIIQYIKQRMAPVYNKANTSVGRNILLYPNLVEISFFGLNQDYFYYFKPAMISSFATNFTPNGVSLNRGGKPSVVTLSMSMTEAQIWTREDYYVRLS